MRDFQGRILSVVLVLTLSWVATRSTVAEDSDTAGALRLTLVEQDIAPSQAPAVGLLRAEISDLPDFPETVRLFYRVVHDVPDGTVDGLPTGAGNGAVDAGERVEIEVVVRHDGKVSARSLSFFLEPLPDASPYVQLIQDESVVGRLDPGATARAGFRFVVSSEAGGRTLVLRVLARDTFLGDLTLPLEIAVPLVEPLSLVSLLVDDDRAGPSAGNDNGRAEAGETVELWFTLSNAGQRAIQGLRLRQDEPFPEASRETGLNVDWNRPVLVGDLASQGVVEFAGPLVLQTEPSARDERYTVRLGLVGLIDGFVYRWRIEADLVVGAWPLVETVVKVERGVAGVELFGKPNCAAGPVFVPAGEYHIELRNELRGQIENIRVFHDDAEVGDRLDLTSGANPTGARSQLVVRFRLQGSVTPVVTLRVTWGRIVVRVARGTVVSAGRDAAGRRLWRRELDDMPMVLIPEGSYPLPQQDGKPARTVLLSAFMIDTREVSNAQFASFLNTTSYEPGRYFRSLSLENQDAVGGGITRMEGGTWRIVPGMEDLPVVGVTYSDAAAYSRWVAHSEFGTSVSGDFLPTEAQWQVAAGTFAYPWGDHWESGLCNSSERWAGDDRTPKVEPGGRLAGESRHGVYDLAGNVWEWCMDRFSPDWPASFADGQRDPVQGGDSGSRAVRGGSFRSDRYGVTTRSRKSFHAEEGGRDLGFRCVLPPR